MSKHSYSEYDRKYYLAHKEKLAEYQIKWRETHWHPCVDCGKPCNYHCQRCKACADAQMRKTPPVFHCRDCGIVVSTKTSRCRKCAAKYRPPRKRAHRTVHSTGYILIYNPSHPKAFKNGYVSEHILVWEKANGRPLPEGWIIHHLNGIKGDNRPVNLQALPNKKHYLLLAAKAKRIQELEALLNNQHQLL